MRSGFGIVLLVTTLFAGGYFYNIVQAVCPIPLEYRIGELDERFGLTLEEAQQAVAKAAQVWEEATQQDLFSYNEEADFTINFIFDERQAFTEAEDTFKERLDAAENVNDAISDTYEQLVAEYTDLKSSYETAVQQYEYRLQQYNERVEQYNSQGGAPPEAYEELEEEKEALDAQQKQLQQTAVRLNDLVEQINEIGEKGNVLVETYNEGVERYNEAFGQQREFTQGDYQGDRINIYTYADINELDTVLAHELGHAMSLDHVEGETSVMYYLIGNQSKNLSLSDTDLGEFSRVCVHASFWDKIVVLLKN